MSLLTTLETVTKEIYLPTLTNNFYRGSPWLKYLTMHQLKQDGGESIVVNLEYAAGALAVGYHKGSTPDVYVDDASSAPEFLSASHAHWVYLRAHTWVHKIDTLENAGAGQIIDLVGARFKAIDRSLRNMMMTQLFTAAADQDDLTSVVDIISDTDPTYPTGGLQSIPVNPSTWWKSQLATCAAGNSDLIAKMQNVFDSCQQDDGDVPDLIMTSQAGFEAYLAEAETKSGLLRDTGEKTADLGFFGATFAGGTVPVVWDSHCPATKMYFLNSDYIQFQVHSQDEFASDGWEKIPNSRDMHDAIYWTGNLICKKRSALGCLTLNP